MYLSDFVETITTFSNQEILLLTLQYLGLDQITHSVVVIQLLQVELE